MTQIEFKKLGKIIKNHKDFKPGDIIIVGSYYNNEETANYRRGIVASEEEIKKWWPNTNLNMTNRVWAFWKSEEEEDNIPRWIDYTSQEVKLLTPTEKILYGASK